MATRVHYSPDIKGQAIKMKKEGRTISDIMLSLNIKNKTQVKTWWKWYRDGETHRFEQPVGKQYTYNKGVAAFSEVESLKLENRQLKTRLEILGKFLEMQRR